GVDGQDDVDLTPTVVLEANDAVVAEAADENGGVDVQRITGVNNHPSGDLGRTGEEDGGGHRTRRGADGEAAHAGPAVGHHVGTGGVDHRRVRRRGYPRGIPVGRGTPGATCRVDPMDDMRAAG